MKISVLLVLLLLLPAAASAELYKWTDAEGRVHFTDKKPAVAAKVETLKVPRAQSPGGTSASGSAPASQGASSVLERQKRMADILTQEREQRESAASKKEKDAANRLKKCQELQDYRRNAARSRIYNIGDKGERTFMDDNAHAAHLRELDENIVQNCQ